MENMIFNLACVRSHKNRRRISAATFPNPAPRIPRPEISLKSPLGRAGVRLITEYRL